MTEIKQAAADAAHVVANVAQKAMENPKVGMGTGVATAMAGVTASDIATWIGICLSAVALYNQLVIARRNWKQRKDDQVGSEGGGQ